MAVYVARVLTGIKADPARYCQSAGPGVDRL